MFIDTHCHLSLDDYDNIDEVIDENRKNDISKIIVSGCSDSSIDEVCEYSKIYNDLYLTIGYHPSEVNIINNFSISKIESLATSNSKVVGIGEIGLDYHYGKEDREQQIILFKKQLELAEKLKLPVVIHSRDAVSDTLNILKDYNVSGVIHCFSGSLEVANQYINMGFLLGIGGVLTFKNSNLYKVIENISLDNIVLETDSPYLSPEPYRGKKNSSKYIPIIAQKVADIKGVSLNYVKDITGRNANKVFDLK